ncbi:hypothetical protein K7432_004270 [Basidiobolus ranarum]|uniref:Epoxide hydrolase N-terminal domain-containing protein n=1 Tax=Basidiobolus ranarum TaxID=34480 RepID=A0ABR2W4V5_9FUNG
MAVPFKIPYSVVQVDELRERLAHTRYPDELEGVGWTYGTPKVTLKSLVDYWEKDFDWSLQVDRLNELNHFKMECNGINVHFAHEKSTMESERIADGSTQEARIPLLLLHGWPGSFIEFGKVIGRLREHFDLVIPSLPGYGYSSAPTKPGFGIDEMAKTFHELMCNLGYTKYAAHGGDWGSIIARRIAGDFPNSCKAIHINMAPVFPPTLWTPLKFARMILGSFKPEWVYTPQEAEGLKKTLEFRDTGCGYQAIQGTKPQTLGYALMDSPAGLLAWILEKFAAWSDCRPENNYESAFTRDEILTNVMIYYTTGTITSSIRLYYESCNGLSSAFGTKFLGSRVDCPVGISYFKEEIMKLPREWLDSELNVEWINHHDRGGHFAALEVPDLLADDLIQYFRSAAVSRQFK